MILMCVKYKYYTRYTPENISSTLYSYLYKLLSGNRKPREKNDPALTFGGAFNIHSD